LKRDHPARLKPLSDELWTQMNIDLPEPPRRRDLHLRTRRGRELLQLMFAY
jgi:hypothetical protein